MCVCVCGELWPGYSIPIIQLLSQVTGDTCRSLSLSMWLNFVVTHNTVEFFDIAGFCQVLLSFSIGHQRRHYKSRLLLQLLRLERRTMEDLQRLGLVLTVS